MKTDIFVLRSSLEMSISLICLFSIVFLLSVDWKKNKWLILIFSLHFWIAFSHMISSGGYGIVRDSSFLLNVTPVILFFPALFFYTQDLVKPNNIAIRQRLPHFIPFITLYIAGVIVGFDEPMATYMRETNAYFTIFFIIMNLIISVTYSYYILQLVKLNQHKYQDKYASRNPFLTLEWINWMVYFLIVTPFLGAFFNVLLKEFFNEGEIIAVSTTVLFGMMGLAFFTFRQPTLYREEQIEVEQKEAKKIVETPIIEEKETSTLVISEVEKAAYIAKIETHFETAKPYLNPKIRMPELARTLDIPRHIFSFIINEHYHKNFFNFINQYRIDHAKLLLKDKENQYYTLETIGEMAGFNSRSTFNKRFKEIVGVSPKAYQMGLNDKAT